MERINIAELLRNCPKGMELDCTVFENLTFEEIDEVNSRILCNIQGNNGKLGISFNKFGCYSELNQAKCVIFPKGKTTWKDFHRPFKDGDIIYVCDEYSDATLTYVVILKQIEKGGQIISHCFYNYEEDYFSTNDSLYEANNTRFATEEEKEELFKVIKDNGYKWNPDTNTLEKLPYFKIGDEIAKKNSISNSYIVSSVSCDYYGLKLPNNTGVGVLKVDEQDEWVLVSNKFDITTLKPFDKVLVRDFDNNTWEISFFSNLLGGRHFKCLDLSYVQCIPYEGNEHLFNTTNKCDEYYVTWES